MKTIIEKRKINCTKVVAVIVLPPLFMGAIFAVLTLMCLGIYDYLYIHYNPFYAHNGRPYLYMFLVPAGFVFGFVLGILYSFSYLIIGVFRGGILEIIL